MRYPKVVVAEQNLGQLAALLRIRVNGFAPYQYNQVKGQPFVVNDLVEEFERLLETKAVPSGAQTFDTKVLNAPNINI